MMKGWWWCLQNVVDKFCLQPTCLLSLLLFHTLLVSFTANLNIIEWVERAAFLAINYECAMNEIPTIRDLSNLCSCLHLTNSSSSTVECMSDFNLEANIQQNQELLLSFREENGWESGHTEAKTTWLKFKEKLK